MPLPLLPGAVGPRACTYVFDSALQSCRAWGKHLGIYSLWSLEGCWSLGHSLLMATIL